MDQDKKLRKVIGEIRARQINCSGLFNVTPEEANNIVESEHSKWKKLKKVQRGYAENV